MSLMIFCHHHHHRRRRRHLSALASFLSVCYCFSVFIWFVSFVFICSSSLIRKWRKCVSFFPYFPFFFFSFLVRSVRMLILGYINNVSCIEVFRPWDDMICSIFLEDIFFWMILCSHWFEIRSSEGDREKERQTDRQREQAIYLCNYAIYLTIYPFHPSALCMHESQKQCNECQVASVGKLVQIWWTHVHIEIHKFWRDSDCEGVFRSEWETERVKEHRIATFDLAAIYLFQHSALVVNQYPSSWMWCIVVITYELNMFVSSKSKHFILVPVSEGWNLFR